MVFQNGPCWEIGSNSDRLPNGPAVRDTNDGLGATLNHQKIGRAVRYFVGAFFEAKMLVAPNYVGDVRTHRQLGGYFWIVSEPIAQHS